MFGMGSVAVSPFVSEKEFLRLPESTDKIELLDGEVIVSLSPSFWHQEVLRRLMLTLGSWANKQKDPVTLAQAPLDVRFGRNRILQPDAFVMFGGVAPTHGGPIDRVPELSVEVLSENRVHDRVTKRLIYAGAGVKEYWIVDPEGGFLERRTGPGLSVEKMLTGVVTTRLLSGFRLDLRRLFAWRRFR
jgi:Uma2 family endonuclease